MKKTQAGDNGHKPNSNCFVSTLTIELRWVNEFNGQTPSTRRCGRKGKGHSSYTEATLDHQI